MLHTDVISYKVNTKQPNLEETAHKKFIKCDKMMESEYLATFYTTQNKSGKNWKKIKAPKVEELN